MESRRGTAVRRAASGLYRTGATAALARAAGHLSLGRPRHLAGGRPPAFAILTYHRVNDEQDPFLPALPTAVFEAQIGYVARAYCVLTVEELVERARRGELPRNAVAVTFDDGYRDNLTHAAPILARHRVPATIFLATGFIGSGEVPWFDRVALALKGARAAAWTGPAGERILLDRPEARVAAVPRVTEALKRLPEDERRRMVARLLEELGPGEDGARKNRMLDWDDVRALQGLGFTVGAHTVSHPILSRVPLAQAREEIAGSRAMIEAATGRAPGAFAYPNGGADDYTAAVVDLVRQAGFTCAVTTRFGLNTGATPPLELRRGGPWERHLPTFALKLAWYRLSL
ncbi:MAG: polysaccharide deacetylase family protein [Candidatus Rokubacteria bacterium]|nr:polysaccharide deacetylase family protein [Candidatus Rokubacteria bacterium]